MNRRAYLRRQSRLASAGCAGVLMLGAGLLIPSWGGDIVGLAGLVIFLASAAAAALAARKFNREALRRALAAGRTESERTLLAIAYGDSVDALKNDALRQGAVLFGTDAALRVMRVAGISTALAHKDRGAFTADVLVRADHARESTDA